MTHQPLTKAEREELRRLHAAATPEPWQCEPEGRGTRVTAKPVDNRGPQVVTLSRHIAPGRASRADAILIAASRNALPRLLADLDAAEADASELRNILLCHNFAPCDTAACNCNGWHERATGNGFYARFREIEEAVGDHNGKTLLKAVQEIVAQRDRAEAERDALIRNINEAFLSLNIPNSTMAFDGRNLLPHAVESARYAEEMRIERDKALADVAKYVDRSESFASAIDHLVSNTADGTDLARITKERDDFRDGMVAMLVAAGAPVDLDAMEAAVLSAGKKPSDFIRQRIRVLTAERDALWVDHRDVVDERDALKAKLAAAESAHSELFLSGQVAELRAKLAALVEACDAKDDLLACCRLTLDSLYADLRQERGE